MQRPEQKKYIFKMRPGSKIEVWSDEDGYQNAWFSATVLKPPTKKNDKKAVVLYHHMISDQDDKEPLVESVDVAFIRPSPPKDYDHDHDRHPYEKYDVVDAFHNDVWWTGFVFEVVNDIYRVKFKCPEDLLDVKRSDLRLHWDWDVANSCWVKPPKEKMTTQPEAIVSMLPKKTRKLRLLCELMEITDVVDDNVLVPLTEDIGSVQETNSLENTNESGETTFPFKKRSPVWKDLESMELFLELPQNPHFRPLLKFPKKERERLAIERMKRYADIMNQISELNQNDSTEYIDCMMRFMAECEEWGFNVDVVLCLLLEWRNTRADLEKVIDKSKVIASAIKQCSDEKAKIESEFSEIKRRTAELTGKRVVMMTEIEVEEHRDKVRKLLSETMAVGDEFSSAMERSRNLVLAIPPQ